MHLDPQVAVAFVASTGVGFLMVMSGLQKHMLEWRRPSRQCPSCGRRISGRTCGCTTTRQH